MIHLFWINPTEPNRQHDKKRAIQTNEQSSHIWAWRPNSLPNF